MALVYHMNAFSQSRIPIKYDLLQRQRHFHLGYLAFDGEFFFFLLVALRKLETALNSFAILQLVRKSATVPILQS